MPRSALVLAALAALSLALGCATAQPRSDVGPERPAYDLADLEARVLAELNRVRRAQRLAPLQPDPALRALARAHSADMVDRQFFAHANPDGQRAGDRARRAGYRFFRFGENLFRGRLYDTVSYARRGTRETTRYRWHTPETFATLVVTMWMESPGHRDNMLSGGFDFGGVGIATGSDDDVFVTLNLSAR